ncbi:profilin [Biomphalaria glabrata]|uniref:Roadblock/LAMTOR2 domain-containing protein n=1 Tax=Biomphalaria glabrata TaxID=6526 RepID=A0A2C9LYD4_BIOGL
MSRPSSMLELMTWSEIIENLKSEGQLKVAVIYDLKGSKIAETSGNMLSEEDGIAVLKSLSSVHCSIYGLFFLGNKFSCMNVDRNTLIGHAGQDLFVAYQSLNFLICAIAGRSEKVSCLGIIKNFAQRLVEDATVPSLM